MKPNFLIIHGMQGKNTDHWYPWLKQQLSKSGFQVKCPNFPNNLESKEHELLDFAQKLINKNTIIIGHSSGASLALRISEQNKIYGSVLVSGLFEDLGYKEEQKTGMFSHSWDWRQIRENQNWIIQFNSDNDPYIPTEHFEKLSKHTQSEHIVLPGKRHFGDPEDSPEKFPEILEILKEKLQLLP